ncbi:MAG: hypothetical protein ACU0DI_14540 [Paracoccaceae bacterium]
MIAPRIDFRPNGRRYEKAKSKDQATHSKSFLFAAPVAAIATPVHAVEPPRELQPSDFTDIDPACGVD